MGDKLIRFLGWATGDNMVRAMLLKDGVTVITDPVVGITYDNGKVEAVKTDKERYYVARD